MVDPFQWRSANEPVTKLALLKLVKWKIRPNSISDKRATHSQLTNRNESNIVADGCGLAAVVAAASSQWLARLIQSINGNFV